MENGDSCPCPMPPPTRRHLATSGDIFGNADWWGWAGHATASSENEPGMLLNVLQGAREHPEQRILWPQMSMVPRLRNPSLEEFLVTEFLLSKEKTVIQSTLKERKEKERVIFCLLV